MEVGSIFKIGAVGILVSVICQVLKHSGREEQAFLTSLAGLVLVLFWMLRLQDMQSWLVHSSSSLRT